MIRKFFYFAFVFMLALPVSAEQQEQGRAIPPVEQASSPYLSRHLLLDPCLRLKSSDYKNDEKVKEQRAEALKQYPAGICNHDAIVKKLFKARFLQYATTAFVHDPWNLYPEIVRQDKAISKCRDMKCLDKSLDRVIDQLLPRYLNAPRLLEWRDLCMDNVDLYTDEEQARSAQGLLETLGTEDNCGQAIKGEDSPDGDSDRKIHSPYMQFFACKATNGTLFIAECRESRNQFNKPVWIYLLQSADAPRLLFSSDDGPYNVLPTTCNGMPDLMTTARINMAEYSKTYYRYDGEQYKPVYRSLIELILNNPDGNDLPIAWSVSRSNIVTCKPEEQ